MPKNTRQHLEDEAMKKFEPSPFQKEVFDKIVGQPGRTLKELPYFPRRMGSRSGYPFIGIDVGQKGGDMTTVVQGVLDDKGGFSIISIDEWGTMPEYKWYRNPIKWWKFRKLWKKIMDIPEPDTYRLKKIMDERKNNVKTN